MLQSRSSSAALALFLVVAVMKAPAVGESVELPRIETADYDSKGFFRINGKPFFPILLYDVPLEDPTLRELKEFGFNVLTCDAAHAASLRQKGFYAACHADRKLDDLGTVLFGLGIDSPALNFKTDLLKQTAEYNSKTLAAVPGRPLMNAIGYWENEPEGVVKGQLPSEANYDELIRHIDVAAPYLYPIPFQPVSSVGDAVRRARKATAGKRPVLPILQLFAWNADDRYPTAAELRCMAFQCLVEGAHGIGYYSYGTVTGRPKTTIAVAQPELWKSVQSLNREIAELGPWLLAGLPSKDLILRQEMQSVRTKTIRDEKGLLMVIVNTSPKQQLVNVQFKSEPAEKLVRQTGRPVEVTQGEAEILIEPFGVEVLRSNAR